MWNGKVEGIDLARKNINEILWVKLEIQGDYEKL